MLSCTSTSKDTDWKQKTRWKDACNKDTESVVLKVNGILNRTLWKRDIQNHSGDPR